MNDATDWDVARVAKALCCDTSTVRRHAQAGRIPGAYKTMGGHWRFRSVEFLPWLEKSRASRASRADT